MLFNPVCEGPNTKNKNFFFLMVIDPDCVPPGHPQCPSRQIRPSGQCTSTRSTRGEVTQRCRPSRRTHTHGVSLSRSVYTHTSPDCWSRTVLKKISWSKWHLRKVNHSGPCCKKTGRSRDGLFRYSLFPMNIGIVHEYRNSSFMRYGVATGKENFPRRDNQTRFLPLLQTL